jgi:superfamily I DNA/RNA helicase
MVISFTRTAAIKIATQKSRITGLPVNLPPENVGTLHSICYHALNSPSIVEVDKKLIRQWNETNDTMAITGQNVSGSLDEVNAEDEVSFGAANGDKLLNKVNIYRNKLIPKNRWLPAAVTFHTRWEKFKQDTATLDFTDLIETALKNVPYAPGRPEVIFVDEAQDMTALQLKLIRSWAFDCRWTVLVGDDDQTIFRFSGASPEAFLDPPVPDNRKTVLDQSFRVPQAVLNRGMKLITQVKNREPKTYHPRKTDKGEPVIGRVTDHTANWKRPDELLVHMKNHDKTCMFLASCSYMLKPLIAQLRAQGLPFHNPFRKANHLWNPIISGGNGVSAKDLLLNFVSRGKDGKYWNVPQFITWAQFLKVGDAGLVRGKGKAAIKALKQAVEDNVPGLHTVENVIKDVLEPAALNHAMENVSWLVDNLLAARSNGMQYPYKIFTRHGIDGLKDQPRIIVGTIHSVKGEDASVVYLFPDISWQARDEMQSSIDGRDSIYRVFYVGMTRAREELVICKPVTRGGSGQEPNLFISL